MEGDKHQVALFIDVQGDISVLLKSAVSLAQIINAEIQVVHVTKPTAVVKKENQQSAIRSMNQEYIQTDKRINDIVSPLIEKYGVPIKYSSTFGNTKNEIDRYINENDPDFLVLGRRNGKSFFTATDSIISYVLKVFKGTVLIVSNNNGLGPGQKIGIGSLNCSEALFNTSFMENLFFHAKSTLKSFNIVKTTEDLSQTGSFLGRKTINFVFDHNENTVKKLPSYLSKSNIDLLFLEGRRKEKESLSRLLNVYDMVKKSDINLLIAGKKHSRYNFNPKLRIT